MTYLIVILFSYQAFAADSMSSIGLKTSWSRAASSHEKIQAAQENIVQSEELRSQAKGSFFPVIEGVGAVTKQEELPKSSVDSTQSTVKITARAPLFRGGQEYAALTQLEQESLAREKELGAERSKLKTEIGKSYYQILALESDLKNQLNEKELLEKRLEVVKSRVSIGRSRKADRLSAEAALKALEANIDLTRSRIRSEREAFSSLSLHERDVNLVDDWMPRPLPPLRDYTGAIARVDQVEKYRLTRNSLEARVDGSKRAHFPDLDLGANYYFKRPAGALEDVSWDATLTLTIPIFGGGVTQSKVRQTSSLLKQSELTLREVEREYESHVRTLYALCESSTSRIKALEASEDLSHQNYDQFLTDDKLGLVSTLDVLSALSLYQSAKRELDRARIEAKAHRMELELLTQGDSL